MTALLVFGQVKLYYIYTDSYLQQHSIIHTLLMSINSFRKLDIIKDIQYPKIIYLNIIECLCF